MSHGNRDCCYDERSALYTSEFYPQCNVMDKVRVNSNWIMADGDELNCLVGGMLHCNFAVLQTTAIETTGIIVMNEHNMVEMNE